MAATLPAAQQDMVICLKVEGSSEILNSQRSLKEGTPLPSTLSTLLAATNSVLALVLAILPPTLECEQMGGPTGKRLCTAKTGLFELSLKLVLKVVPHS